MPARPPSFAAAVVSLVALVVLAGCQMDLTVEIEVGDDGSGSVTVGAGLDDDALARAGSLEDQLRVDDLRAAGWTITSPTREAELTWVRATKAFSSSSQAAGVLAEVTGPDGAFRDFAVRVDDGVFGTDYELTGSVDLTEGPSVFGDDELAAVLGGDPFGGTLDAIERDEGRPIAEMVEFQVVVDLPGSEPPSVYSPSFVDDAPTQISVTSSRRSSLATIAIWVLIAVVVVIGLVVLRNGYRRVSR